MPRSKYNRAAMQYAMDYLDQLLEVESMVNEKVEKKLDMMLERKLAEQQRKSVHADGHATATNAVLTHAATQTMAADDLLTDSSQANTD